MTGDSKPALDASGTAAEQVENRAAADFRAALHEFESNVEVRRLMIVVVHVLVPGMSMVLVNTMCGTNYPPQLAWLPAHMPWIAGAVLAIGGVWTSAILGRCHFGLVVNGTKLKVVRHGTQSDSGLNWLGVTTNFLALTAVAGAGGIALSMATLGLNEWGLGLGIAWLLLPMLWLLLQHRRAVRLCGQLRGSWQHGALGNELLEEHARRSLDAASADISIVVTMAVALFAGTFDALSNLGGLSPQALPAGVALADAQWVFGVGLGTVLLIGLLLSARIVVRLRLAVADHSAELARLRKEDDDPWRFDPRERTFLLFLVVTTLAVAAALMLAWTLGGALAGAIAAGVLTLASLLWYPFRLIQGGRAAKRR